MKKIKGSQKRLSDKKRLAFSVLAVVIFAAVGLTLAVSKDSSIFRRLFHLTQERTRFVETIPEPLVDWQPCEEKGKSIAVTNDEGSEKYVRIRFDESWKQSDGTTDLPLVKDGVRLAQINFSDNWEDYWELRDDGYYYYKTTLALNATTESLIKSVTLNCDADFGADNICTQTATGQECTKPNDEWEGSEYHLEITGETSDQPMGNAPHVVDCESNNLYDKVACQAPETQTAIDFRRGAVASGSDYDKNGNGVNISDENGSTVYYYRGQIDDNYVIWANKCWRLVRTTATGGTKIIYIGEPDNGACPDAASTTTMSSDMYSFGVMWHEDPEYSADSFRLFTWTMLGESGWDCMDNEPNLAIFGYTADDCYDSYADAGYMYGERKPVKRNRNTIPQGNLAWANDVAYVDGHYVLDPATTTTGDFYNDDAYYEMLLGGSHYSCFSTSTTCDTVYYLILGGIYIEMHNGERLPDYLTTTYSNLTDSVPKIALEDWYHKELLSYDGDVEDAVYCNDRGLFAGSLKSKDEGPISVGNYLYPAYFNVYRRNNMDYDNNFHPNLSCERNDSFTVANENGNRKSRHKIGLMSADEMTFAGINSNYNNGDGNFLNYDNYAENLLMSPHSYGSNAGAVAAIYAADNRGLTNAYAFQPGRGVPGVTLRPVVSLKQSKTFTRGDGTRTNPYVVE